MYVLLTSARRKRYRDDVLRILAAPCGAPIKVRYAETLVTRSIWGRPEAAEGADALFCIVDLDETTGNCPLIPIRMMKIDKVFKHGSTLSMALVADLFAYAGDTPSFTNEVATKSDGRIPHDEGPGTDAEPASDSHFLFRLVKPTRSFNASATVEVWEQITEKLCEIQEFKTEPFFWTVLGLWPGRYKQIGDVNESQPWPEEIKIDRDYTLAVYVFHPGRDKWLSAVGGLRLDSDVELVTYTPDTLPVDSPYDLKHWTFRIKHEGIIHRRKAWLRIGEVSPTRDRVKAGQGAGNDSQMEEENQTESRKPAATPPDWEIDLPLGIKFSWGRAVGMIGVIGLLVASPSVISIILQKDPSSTEKVFACLGAIILGFAASTAAALAIKKNV